MPGPLGLLVGCKESLALRQDTGEGLVVTIMSIRLQPKKVSYALNYADFVLE